MFHDRDFFTFASPLPTVKPRFWALIKPFNTIVWVMNFVVNITSAILFYIITNLEVVASVDKRHGSSLTPLLLIGFNHWF